MLEAVTSSTAKCAKCGSPLGPTGTVTVIGADWFHSWCAPIQPVVAATPHGCICPPTSEQTCAGIACPRRPPMGYVRPTQPNTW